MLSDLTFKSRTCQGRHVNSHSPDGVCQLSFTRLMSAKESIEVSFIMLHSVVLNYHLVKI